MKFDEELKSQLDADQIKSDAQAMQKMRSHVALESITPPVQGVSEGAASPADYLQAVQDIYDMQERIGFPFIMLGDFAKAIRDRQPSYAGPKIEMGMPDRYLTKEVKSNFLTWKFTEEKYGFSYTFTPPIRWTIKVPIEIKAYHRHYDFFDNPDIGWFGNVDFRIPNPFQKYWKARNLIQ